MEGALTRVSPPSEQAQYEMGLERNLKLVDRLLNDKTELTKRCELFTEELKTVERKFQLKLEEVDDKASKELERQKKNWMAAERLRREAWEKDKVREIKEMTIKGLQPEAARAQRKSVSPRAPEVTIGTSILQMSTLSRGLCVRLQV